LRILYLCHRIPYPPNKGEKIRAFHQLRALAARHDLDLFTLSDDLGDPSDQSELNRCCRRVLVAKVNPTWQRLRALGYLLGRTPLTVPYFYSSELQQGIKEAISSRSYDRIFIYCSSMAQYVENNAQIPTVMDLVDVDSDKWMQYAAFSRFPMSALYRREGRCLREYELTACERASCTVVTTAREAELVKLLSERIRVHVIPNGVDTAYFSPEAVIPQPSVPTVMFTGDMSYYPNVQAVTYFAQSVFPLIVPKIPNARFLIVGRNPARAVRALAKIKNIEVTGFVPDVRSYLAQSQVSVAPFSIAAGIQNKILEALAYGIPVVANAKAVQGLSKGAANAIQIANDATEMAEKIVQLLRDPSACRALGSAGRQQVTADYDWENALGKLVGLVENPYSDDIVELLPVRHA
jgi:sugar transferase (PEP-CTERM/EpsH1 system associated)